MSDYRSRDHEIEQRIRASFARQRLINTLHEEIVHISPGEVHITAPFDERFTQQDGFLHAGIVTSLIDSACGYAAYTLMPTGSRVLSVEFKVNLLNPAEGESFRAEGRVVKSGKTLTVCEGKLFALSDSQEKLVAIMQTTMICVPVTVERGVQDKRKKGIYSHSIGE
jgi:uncharacterized protein (TIGR00369 family)